MILVNHERRPVTVSTSISLIRKAKSPCCQVNMLKVIRRRSLTNLDSLISRQFCSNASESDDTVEDFEKMSFIPTSRVKRGSRERFDRRRQQPRYTRMPVNQDWNSVWPTARTFNANSVPLPMFQGGLGVYDDSAPRYDKFYNVELTKIQNFLHLAPTNVKKQCAAIKKFCRLVVSIY